MSRGAVACRDRYVAARFPEDASCADCGGVIPARAGCYRRVDAAAGHPVVCRPRRHAEPPEERRKKAYVVVVPHIVGDAAHFEMCYHADGQRFDSRELAISHGFETTGHDDWLILTLEGNQAVAVGWMHDDRDDAGELAAVAKALLLEASR
jgi:hypothetical protein